jgi:hypothetical protein
MLQTRREKAQAARRKAEQRVTQRWGSQDPEKIARECGIDMSGPMDRYEPVTKAQKPVEKPKLPKWKRKRKGSVWAIPTAFETNRKRH